MTNPEHIFGVMPCHWRLLQNQVAIDIEAGMAHNTDAGEAHAIYTSIAPYFAEDGIELAPPPQSETFYALAHAAPQRWPDPLGLHPLAAAHGQNAHHLMPENPALRRLLAEMQMLLYQHPVNEAREARGVQPLNGLWFFRHPSLFPDPANAPPQNGTQPEQARPGFWQRLRGLANGS